MKINAKQTTTAAIALLITIMLFVIFVLLFNYRQDKVAYIVDEANSCIWERGVVVSSTEIFNPKLDFVEVQFDKKDVYLQDAQMANSCIALWGDTSGFYATQLNKQFEAQ